MAYVVKKSGAPRPIRADFRCREHGVFTALVHSGTDDVPCPHMYHDEDNGLSEQCGIRSPWSPSVIPMRMRRVEAVRGSHERAQHKGWLDTSNLEEGQPFDEYESDREAVAEDLRKDLVMDMVRSDR